ncbi:MAG: hypothetical protein ACPHY8_02150 [Patescibacteria group bacterium]
MSSQYVEKPSKPLYLLRLHHLVSSFVKFFDTILTLGQTVSFTAILHSTVQVFFVAEVVAVFTYQF